MSANTDQDKEVKINLVMPKLLVSSESEQDSADAHRLMRSIAGACAFLVQKNYAAQECMDMLNFICQKDGVLHIAFNHDQPIDLDHFRMAMVTILSAVEGEAGVQRVSISAPLSFGDLDYGSTEEEGKNAS